LGIIGLWIGEKLEEIGLDAAVFAGLGFARRPLGAKVSKGQWRMADRVFDAQATYVQLSFWLFAAEKSAEEHGSAGLDPAELHAWLGNLIELGQSFSAAMTVTQHPSLAY
jgi:hypothetical protein